MIAHVLGDLGMMGVAAGLIVLTCNALFLGRPRQWWLRGIQLLPVLAGWVVFRWVLNNYYY